MSIRLALIAMLAAFPGMAGALDLTLPAPVIGEEAESQSPASVELPTGPFAGGTLPTARVTGALDRRAWQLDAPRLTLTELANPLREALLAQGFTLLFDCETMACGGFDFRIAIDVMAEPGMHVDLGDFRFIAATRGDEVVNLLVSRSPAYGFVQLTRVAATPLQPEATGPAPDPVQPVTPAPVVAPVAVAPGDIAGELEADGAVALEDLVFASGAATLEGGSYGSLKDLGAWLAADPARAIILVGHTDVSGGLAANVALSKKRAQAVRQVLLQEPGVAAAQVSAEGVGPLAPRSSNLTDEGRQKNRRVEAVMTSTQ